MKSVLLFLGVALFAGSAVGRTFYVPGAGGVPLSVTDVGVNSGPEVLFLHGIGQGQASFRPQLGPVDKSWQPQLCCGET